MGDLTQHFLVFTATNNLSAIFQSNAMTFEDDGRLFATEKGLVLKVKSLIFFRNIDILLKQTTNNIDQKNLLSNDDNTDAIKGRGKNDYLRCTSCNVQSSFTYRGLN